MNVGKYWEIKTQRTQTRSAPSPSLLRQDASGQAAPVPLCDRLRTSVMAVVLQEGWHP